MVFYITFDVDETNNNSIYRRCGGHKNYSKCSCKKLPFQIRYKAMILLSLTRFKKYNIGI